MSGRKLNARLSALPAAVFALTVALGCSTVTDAPVPEPPALVPKDIIKAEHPAGTDMGDLRALLGSTSAPPHEQLAKCRTDFDQLVLSTLSKEELQQGVLELVTLDPEAAHWCFYSQLLDLEDRLKTEDYLDEKQKAVLKTFRYLVPTARAFMERYRDSRYMRYASARYQKLSEWLFFRKVELTPQASFELVEAANPFGVWRSPPPRLPVLEKYNIAAEKRRALMPHPEASTVDSPGRLPDPAFSPFAEVSPNPSVSPLEDLTLAQPGPLPTESPSDAPDTVPQPEVSREPAAAPSLGEPAGPVDPTAGGIDPTAPVAPDPGGPGIGIDPTAPVAPDPGGPGIGIDPTAPPVPNPAPAGS